MKKSAGILIYRKKNGKIQVFLVHPGGPFWKNKDLNSWSIPKGEITQADFLDHADKRRLNNAQIDADEIDNIYADRRGSNNTRIDADKDISDNQRNNNPRESAYENNIRVNPRLNPRKSALLNTAIREFEEETGIVLTDEDKEKIFYLGEVKSKNKIVYVFALEKDLGDNIEIKSNLVRRRLSRLNADYAEKYQESKLTRTKSENKFIEFPEVDKGEYFDLEVAREKLVSYQKELVDMIKFM